MTHKQIDQMRETRLWIGQIIVPVMTIIFAVPESRESVVNGIKDFKFKVNRKWTEIKNKR